MILIVSILMGLLTAFLFLLLVTYFKRRQSIDIFHRMRRHNVKSKKKVSEVENAEIKFLNFIKKIAKPFSSWNLAQSLDFKIKQAGLPLLGAEFIIAVLIFTGLASLLIYILTLNKFLTMIVAAMMPFLLWLVVLFLINRRREAFTEQLGDCLTTVANALRAGYGFQQAMDVIAKEMEPPISEEFARVTADMTMGISLESALEQMNKRVGSADFDLVVTAVLIQREVGGNLAQILDSISDTINERIRMKREILALTAQGRFSAWVLLALPFAAGAFMYMFNQEQMMILFTDPMGQIAIVVSIIMEIIGFIVIRKIVDIDV